MKLSLVKQALFLLMSTTAVVAQDYQYDSYQGQDYQGQDYQGQDYQAQDYQAQDYQQGQDYQYDNYDNQDYYAQGEDNYAQGGEDTLYQDYAQSKAAAVEGGGNGGMMKMMGAGITGWFLGGMFHSKRAVKKATAKSYKQQKELYLKYVQDVGALQQQIADLQEYMRQATKQQLADEFLEADLDGSRTVTRYEFEMHKKKYLAKHPEAAATFPKFEDFDPDANGMVTMAEHEQFYTDRGML